jgi:hypothetical protein
MPMAGFVVVPIMMRLSVLILMMVMGRHGELFDTAVGMDHLEIGIGSRYFSRCACSNSIPAAP